MMAEQFTVQVDKITGLRPLFDGEEVPEDSKLTIPNPNHVNFERPRYKNWFKPSDVFDLYTYNPVARYALMPHFSLSIYPPLKPAGRIPGKVESSLQRLNHAVALIPLETEEPKLNASIWQAGKEEIIGRNPITKDWDVAVSKGLRLQVDGIFVIKEFGTSVYDGPLQINVAELVFHSVPHYYRSIPATETENIAQIVIPD